MSAPEKAAPAVPPVPPPLPEPEEALTAPISILRPPEEADEKVPDAPSEPPVPDVEVQESATRALTEAQGLQAPRPTTVSRSELSRVLDMRVSRVLAVEKRRDSELAQARNDLASAAVELRKEIERMEAAERRLVQKQQQLDELLGMVKSMEDDRNAARNARVALEALRTYYQFGSRGESS